MTTYYVDYYRDACNTYTVYAVASADLGRFAEAFPDAERIDRREAIRLGWSRVREAKKDGEHWPAGFASSFRHGDDTPTVALALEQCRLATADAIDEKLAHAEN